MPARTAQAIWNGSLTEGTGTLTTATGALNGPYDWRSRAEDGTHTNPEELIAAAHAGCFNMAFSHILGGAGFTPTRLETKAVVHLEKTDGGFAITKIDLHTQGEVPGLDQAAFLEHATAAKTGCPVSKALAGTEITLEATLVETATA